MRDTYNRRGGNRGGFGSRRDTYDKPQMYDAVCDECGRDCQVPFRPSGDKPIYCSKCFEKLDPRNNARGPSREDSFRSRNSYQRDDYQKLRYNDKPKNNNAEISQLKDQLGSISAKLDKLLRLVTPEVIEEEVEKVPFKGKAKVKTIKELKDEIESVDKEEKKVVKKKVVKKKSK